MSTESPDDRSAVETGGRDGTSTEPIPAEEDRHRLDPSVREFPWLRAAVGGATTLLVQYVVVGLVFVSGLASSGATGLTEQLKSVGFVLYGAHHVPIVRTASEVTFQGPRRFNVVTGAQDPTVPIVVYLAIPVVTLVLAGAIFEWLRADDDAGLLEGAATVGVGYVPGYLLVGLLGSFLVVSTTYFDPGSVTQAVDRLSAFVATIAYPLVCATLGSLAVRYYRTLR